MPNALDRTWSNLMAGLDDNNEGAITEEDVRAVGAYARHSSLEQAFGEPTDDLGEATWGTFPAPDDNTPYLRLYTQAPLATKSYLHASGHLAQAANLGVRYTEGDPVTTGVTQARQISLTWAISIESPYDTLWGLSFWRLVDGGNWPGELDEWPEDEIYPLAQPQAVRTLWARQEELGNVWGAVANGTIVATLNPGDTIVPVLEYYGTFDSTGASPAGNLTSFTVRASSHGPVEGDWEADAADLWDLAKVSTYRQIVAGETDLNPVGGNRQQIQVVETLPDTGLYTGLTTFLTTDNKLRIYGDGDAWNVFSPDPWVLPSFVTRPVVDLYAGLAGYETSTGRIVWYSGTEWIEFSKDGGYRAPGVMVRRTSGQSIADDTQVKVIWNGTEDRDVGTYHAADSTDIVIPTGLGGLYHVDHTTFWDANAAGRRQVLLYRNNAVQPASALRSVPVDTGGAMNMSGSGYFVLDAGDVLDLRVAQTSGGSLNCTAVMGVIRVGPA
jgi:hypothetical protein